MIAPRTRGFTLIEVVVATAIFALCAGALYESFSGSIRRSAAARERSLALLTAQSLLSELRTTPGPWESTRAGTSADGRPWRIAVTPFDADSDSDSEWHAFEVTVEVRSARSSAGAVTVSSVELLRVSP
jgi:type II secretion system protein I